MPEAVEKAKASMRAFVEQPFHIVKNLFRQRKVRCRGLAKNGHQLDTLFGLANVVIGSRAAATGKNQEERWITPVEVVKKAVQDRHQTRIVMPNQAVRRVLRVA